MATSNRLTSILGRMADLEHTDPIKTFFGMIYGPPGSGKTTLAIGLAQSLRGEGDILLIDTSEGWVSLENMPFLMEHVQRVPVTDSKDMPVIADALLSGKGPLKNVSVVVVDEHSSLASDVLENVVRERAGVASAEDMPEIEGKDYGPMGAIVMSFTKKLQKAPNLHVILVAHDREKEDKRRGTLIQPQYTPLLLKDLQKLSHVTGYVSARVDAKGEYTRQVQAQPTALIQAKSRIGSMPLVTDFGNFVDTISTWIGSGQISEDLLKPEENVEVPEGTLPYDGPAIDADDPLGGSDDEPIIVSE